MRQSGQSTGYFLTRLLFFSPNFGVRRSSRGSTALCQSIAICTPLAQSPADFRGRTANFCVRPFATLYYRQSCRPCIASRRSYTHWACGKTATFCGLAGDNGLTRAFSLVWALRGFSSYSQNTFRSWRRCSLTRKSLRRTHFGHGRLGLVRAAAKCRTRGLPTYFRSYRRSRTGRR